MASASYSSNKVCGGCEVWRLRWLSPLAGRGGEGRRPSALQQLLQAQGPAARSPACASDAGYPSALIWCRRLWWEATAVFVEGGGSLNVCARFGSRFCKIRKWLPLLAGRGGEEKVVPVEGREMKVAVCVAGC
nr:uncharacterized protein LOC127333155 [Lolium perenne]XP_051227870.1 uncharacterized protein LOC127345436 [Lolium perenne]